MKKNYENAKLKIVTFPRLDVMCASTNTDDDLPMDWD